MKRLSIILVALVACEQPLQVESPTVSLAAISSPSAPFTLDPGTVVGFNRLPNTLVKYSTDGTLLQTLPLVSPPSANFLSFGATVLNSQLYVLGNPFVGRVDLVSGDVIDRIGVSGRCPTGLGAIGPHFLVGDWCNFTVARIHPDGTVISTITLKGPFQGIDGLDSDGSSLYVASNLDQHIYIYDLAGNLTGSIATGLDVPGAPQFITGLDYDPSTNTLWVSTGGSTIPAIRQFTLGGTLVNHFPTLPFFFEVNGLTVVQEAAVIEITEARMVSPTELGVDLKVTVPDSDPDGGPWTVRFEAEINGTPVTTDEFDLSGLLDPGDTDKEIEFDRGEDEDVPPRVIDFEDWKIPLFDTKQEFDLTAILTGPASTASGTRRVEILLPIVVVHGLLFGPAAKAFFSIPLGVYEPLFDRLEDEGYTKDPTWYQTLWFMKYTWRESPASIRTEVNEEVTQALAATYASKVDIIGHSLGGLIGRHYSRSDIYHTQVNRVVLVGSPSTGSATFFDRSSGWSVGKLMSHLTTRNPDGSDVPTLLRWLIPQDPQLFLADNSSVVVPAFARNNFDDLPPRGDVTYCSVYNTKLKTPEELTVAETREWFIVTDLERNQHDGDEIVTAVSARLDGSHPAMTNQGVAVENGGFSLFRPFNVTLPFHADMLSYQAIQDKTLTCLGS